MCPTTSSLFRRHFDGLWRGVLQLLGLGSVLVVLVLAALVLAVEVMAPRVMAPRVTAPGVTAPGVMAAGVWMLLKFELGDLEACPRPVYSHPSGGQLASAGVVVCHCLEGDRHPKSHRRCYIPRCFLYKFVRLNLNQRLGVGTYETLPPGCWAYAGRLGRAQ